MDVLKRIFCGMIVGIANIIPGVSGGTMMVTFGIYDRLIESLTTLFKDLRKNILFLIPLAIGMGIGIIGFTYIIEYLLDKHTLPTCMAFIGLILGGLPMLWGKLNEKRLEKKAPLFSPVNILCFLIFMALVIVLPLLKGSDNELNQIQPGVLTAVILFFVGILASATMIIPGVSGSMVLMIIGYYYGIINAIKVFFDALKAFDINAIISQCAVLIPFGIGVIVGIFGVAKLINYLFNRHGVSTYCGIFGLILASPFAIIYQSGAYKSVSIISFVIGIFLMAACGAGAYFMSKITAE
ncbi:MAG: DUF368 domain-containing protein [Spirochaetales bacterium]|nr:DUF368 domain-containing protein [Spirochaetales bacterium]